MPGVAGGRTGEPGTGGGPGGAQVGEVVVRAAMPGEALAQRRKAMERMAKHGGAIRRVKPCAIRTRPSSGIQPCCYLLCEVFKWHSVSPRDALVDGLS